MDQPQEEAQTRRVWTLSPGVEDPVGSLRREGAASQPISVEPEAELSTDADDYDTSTYVDSSDTEDATDIAGDTDIIYISSEHNSSEENLDQHHNRVSLGRIEPISRIISSIDNDEARDEALLETSTRNLSNAGIENQFSTPQSFSKFKKRRREETQQEDGSNVLMTSFNGWPRAKRRRTSVHCPK